MLILSNLAWLLPAWLAYQADVLLLAIPALVVMLLSMWFHFTESDIAESLDTIFSIMYIVTGPVLIFMAGNSVGRWGTWHISCYNSNIFLVYC